MDHIAASMLSACLVAHSPTSPSSLPLLFHVNVMCKQAPLVCTHRDRWVCLCWHMESDWRVTFVNVATEISKYFPDHPQYFR